MEKKMEHDMETTIQGLGFWGIMGYQMEKKGQ